jgi:hypothetical protein
MRVLCTGERAQAAKSTADRNRRRSHTDRRRNSRLVSDKTKNSEKFHYFLPLRLVAVHNAPLGVRVADICLEVCTVAYIAKDLMRLIQANAVRLGMASRNRPFRVPEAGE